jgi:hypothetical protein
MSHPRDPRARRHRDGGAFAPPVDVAAAAIRLEVAADAMRAGLLDRGPADVATAVQSGTVEPPLSAAEFAAALADPFPDLLDVARAVDTAEPATPECSDAGHIAAGYHLASSCEAPEAATVPEPAPVAPVAVTPSEPAPAPDVVPPVFRNEHPTLSWRSRHDVRSRSYGVRPTLRGSVAWQEVTLPLGPVLDQGAEGACFGYAAAAAINAMRLAGLLEGAPLAAEDAPDLLDADDARELYGLAQRRDERPGEDYDGTSVTGGMAAVVEEQLAGGYLWSFGTRDIAQTLLHRRGAVIVGVPWLSGMYDTGPGGLVQLDGDDSGLGHCLAVVGLRVKGPQGQPGPFFVWQNSWGTGYGDGGLGYVHHRDLAALLHAAGEAAVPTRDVQVPS